MKNKHYFPMFVDLTDKKIVVVGGGTVACRRIRTLLQFTRNITVVAPKLAPEVQEMAKLGQITLVQRPVKRSDFTDAYMVLAATNDLKLNDDIYRVCKEEGVYVNVSSDREKCDFYFPGVYIRDEIVVGVTASGLDHRLARMVREELEKTLNRVIDEY